MKLKAMDKVAVRAVQDAMAEALKSVEKKFGVKIQSKGGNFSSESAVLKFEVAVVGASGTVESRERQDFKRYAALGLDGLKPEMLDAEFVSGGRKFVVTGYNPRATKMPVLGKEVVSGKSYKFAVAVMVRGLPKS